MTRTSTRRGPYAKSADVRQRIVEAGIDVIGSAGFHGATMKAIAQRAGISQSGLLHHFPSKHAVLDAVLEHRVQFAAERLTATGSGGSGALTAVLDIIRDNEQRPGLVGLSTVLSAETTEPSHPAHQRYRQDYDGLRTFYALVFQALADERRLTTSLRPAELAVILCALQDGLQIQWLHARDAVDMVGTVRAFLRSIGLSEL